MEVLQQLLHQEDLEVVVEEALALMISPCLEEEVEEVVVEASA